MSLSSTGRSAMCSIAMRSIRSGSPSRAFRTARPTRSRWGSRTGICSAISWLFRRASWRRVGKPASRARLSRTAFTTASCPSTPARDRSRPSSGPAATISTTASSTAATRSRPRWRRPPSPVFSTELSTTEPPMSSAAALKQPDPVAPIPAEPMGLLAVRLLALAQKVGPRGVVHVAGSDRRAERLGRLLAGLAPSLDVIVLPAWDCLPYDRAAPSREVMGRRVAALRRLAEAARGPRILVATPDALLQRAPPKETWAQAGFALEAGESFDLAALEAYLGRAGYVLDERVDEPGEAAIRGGVIDVFPGGAVAPFRLEHAEGRVTAIRCYDPVSQRTEEEVAVLRLDPVSEIVPPEAEDAAERFPGAEHWLADFYPRLDTLFDYAPEAEVILEAKAEERCGAVLDQIADAHEGRTTLRADA